MRAKQPIEIGSHSFESKKECREYIIGILDRWFAKRVAINNGRITDNEVLLDGKDLSFVKQLFKRHPRFAPKCSEAKYQGGIEGICVAPNINGSRSFYLKTRKPPMIDFSYQRCISRKDKEG